jgi:hypothetical protein
MTEAVKLLGLAREAALLGEYETAAAYYDTVFPEIQK